MPALSPEEFLERAAAAQVLLPLVVEIVRADLLRHPDWTAADLADFLVEQHRLSRWQADGLLSGRMRFTVGKYRLLDRIGAGGMGVVLKARQVNLQRVVAVKILSKSQLHNELAVRRFYREVKAAAALDHPNIVRALDADYVLGVPFLVMEYVDGRDLVTIVKRDGALPVTIACEIVRQVCLGLQHAFECGLVHRDVKPGNVLLTRTTDGQLLAKILDFGMARFISETAGDDLTRPDQVFGTIDFLAPEQARSARSADIRADVFGAGCTLFYLLAGRSPCPGQTPMEKLSARLENRFVPLASLRPDLPADLMPVLERFLAADPEDRYQTPAAAAAALEPFTTGIENVGELVEPEPISSSEPAPVTDSDKTLERFLSDLPPEPFPSTAPHISRVWWSAVVLVVVLLVTAAVMYWRS